MDASSMSEDEGSPGPVQRRTPTTARRKKSAEQIEMLERLYAENKYPSEEVRAKLSVQLDLSEKQLQIWFTHRRHKDRKDGVEDVKLTFYAMRHKGGEAHLDFMEELTGGKRAGGSLLGREDTSSSGGNPPSSGGNPHSRGGTPSSGGRTLSSGGRPLFSGAHPPISYSGGEINNARLVGGRKTDSESENSGLGHAEDVMTRGYKPPMKRVNLERRKAPVQKRPMILPSRAKVDAKALELSAISAVETQLGTSIRIDGPNLGMEFDSLPPNAWARLANIGGTVSVPVQTQTRVPLSVQGRVGRFQSIGSF